MAVSDLTGTTWEFNSTVYCDNRYFYINFESNGSTFDAINCLYWYDDIPFPHGENYMSYGTGGGTQVCSGDVGVPGAYNWVNQAYRTIAITGGTDVTNANFISWLETNATQVIEPSGGSLTVTYNSSDIIETTSDGTYTLPCSGKIMSSDIVIDAVDVNSLTVTYNNSNIINAVSGTHTYTLSCNGKYMSSDIGIEVEFGSSVVLHEQEGSTVYLYGAYTKTQSGSVVTIT